MRKISDLEAQSKNTAIDDLIGPLTALAESIENVADSASKRELKRRYALIVADFEIEIRHYVLGF